MNETREAFSQIDIFEDEAVIIKFNGNPEADKAYIRLQKEDATHRKKEMEMLNKEIQKLPDSLKSDLPRELIEPK